MQKMVLLTSLLVYHFTVKWVKIILCLTVSPADVTIAVVVCLPLTFLRFVSCDMYVIFSTVFF